jgi:competence CoiA-like predicted nuclease
MIYAQSADGRRIGAQRQVPGYCPGCREELTAKCGPIVVHHWAHRASDCDPWYEPESAWHLGWKKIVRPDAAEVVMGCHRADIVGNHGTVVELQASQIALHDARAREQFYRQMVWVIDARAFEEHLDFRDRGDYQSFRWKYPRKVWSRVTMGWQS